MRDRILHLADLHLGDTHTYLGPRSSERSLEANSLLRRLTDAVLAPTSRVGGVFIVGDLFDTHEPSEELTERVVADLRRLVDAGILVLTVPGNHDEYSYPSCVYRRWEGRWPGDLVTNPVPARVATWNLAGNEIDLYAMAYVAGRSREPHDNFEVEARPARKIGLFHGSLDTPWTDRSLPLRSENLERLGLDYVALGHIHRPKDRRLGRTWVVYPGRLEGGGFDDPGVPEIVEIDTASPELRPVRRPFAVRGIREEQWYLVAIESESELESRLEQAADTEAILRVRLEGQPGFVLDATRLRERWRGRFYHLEILADQDTTAAWDLEAVAEEHTIRGVFVRLAREKLAEAAGNPGLERVRRTALRHGLSAFDRAARGGYAAGPEE